MLSRVANAIYWTSRYLERAENISRITHVNLHYELGNSTENFDRWFSLVKASGDEKMFYKRFKNLTYENVLKFLITDKKYLNSIYSCVKAGRENARTIREIISGKMWEDINHLYWVTEDFSKKRSLSNKVEDFLRAIQDIYMSFLGACESTMSHNEAWHFSRLGRMIERGDKMGRILDVHYFAMVSQANHKSSEIVSAPLMAKALLKSVSAFSMYRQKFSEISAKNVTLFLLSSPNFPRSILFCTRQTLASIDSICKYSNHPRAHELQIVAGKLLKFVEKECQDEFSNIRLHDFVDEFQTKVNAMDSKIFETFFSTEAKPESFRAYQKQSQVLAIPS